MIEIRASTQRDEQAQKTLWQTCFGDTPAFIELFYRYCTTREDVLLLLEDGALRSMAALLPMGLHFPGGETGKAGYIYALCTDPASRSKGFIRALLGEADAYLKQRGYDCVTLVPAEASLHRFFSSQGFEECFSNRMAEVAAAMLPAPDAGGAVTPVEPAEYGRIRESLLRDQFHVSYDDALLTFQQAESRMLGGDLYRIALGSAVGCAAADFFRPDRVLVRELLIAPEYISQAAGLLARTLSASRYHLRSPAFQEGLPGSYVQAYGMIKWYNDRLRSDWCREKLGYLGLGFD